MANEAEEVEIHPLLIFPFFPQIRIIIAPLTH
jgi:hypothetical protein